MADKSKFAATSPSCRTTRGSLRIFAFVYPGHFSAVAWLVHSKAELHSAGQKTGLANPKGHE
ncbi:MAG: hypothetical protein DME23_05310 [Verrucomicrobia bacterium]|nr:MAG: hypothetical protein DME23_05310 [Verrucomicrobiota bacterium]